MRKANRILLFLVVLLAITGIAFARGGGQTSGGVTLKVLYYLEATAPNAVADANLWFDTFEKNNPGVKIERENLFDDPYHDKMRAYAAAGDLPDVLYVWPSGRSDYLHDQIL